MGKKRIVLDTNVIVSAFGWEGNARSILNKATRGIFDIILSVQQYQEIKRVLDYPKFKFSEEQKSSFLSILVEICIMIETEEKLKIVKEDPSDNIILESAVEGKADFIASGDQHLLKLKEYEGVKIVTPKEFLDLI